MIDRPQPLTPALSQPKSDISDFGPLKVPNSGKPEFGCEERGEGARGRACKNAEVRAQLDSLSPLAGRGWGEGLLA